MSTDQPGNDAVITHLRDLLLRHGLRPMLVFLNGMTSFRFSAVTRLENGVQKTVCYYDREDPRPDALPDIPESESYCQYVKARRDVFPVPDALHEPLLQTHPARNAVRSYCGVPLFDRDGNVLGTVCHFHVDPLEISERDSALLKAAAELLMQYDALSPSSTLRR